MKEKKITLTLRLTPYDALRVLKDLNDKGKISDRMYLNKADVVIAQEPLMIKVAEKE